MMIRTRDRNSKGGERKFYRRQTGIALSLEKLVSVTCIYLYIIPTWRQTTRYVYTIYFNRNFYLLEARGRSPRQRKPTIKKKYNKKKKKKEINTSTRTSGDDDDEDVAVVGGVAR